MTPPAAYNGKQPGDPVKGVKVIIDLVRGEGFVKGKTVPSTIALGTDSYAMIKANLESRLKEMEEWKELICSTDL